LALSGGISEQLGYLNAIGISGARCCVPLALRAWLR
jgi:hypothetical protein